MKKKYRALLKGEAISVSSMPALQLGGPAAPGDSSLAPTPAVKSGAGAGMTSGSGHYEPLNVPGGDELPRAGKKRGKKGALGASPDGTDSQGKGGKAGAGSYQNLNTPGGDALPRTGKSFAHQATLPASPDGAAAGKPGAGSGGGVSGSPSKYTPLAASSGPTFSPSGGSAQPDPAATAVKSGDGKAGDGENANYTASGKDKGAPDGTDGDPGRVLYAGKNQTFAIKTPADVAKAAAAFGDAQATKDNFGPDQLKTNLISIARRLGADFVAKLPKGWATQKNPLITSDDRQPSNPLREMERTVKQLKREAKAARQAKRAAKEAAMRPEERAAAQRLREVKAAAKEARKLAQRSQREAQKAERQARDRARLLADWSPEALAALSDAHAMTAALKDAARAAKGEVREATRDARRVVRQARAELRAAERQAMAEAVARVVTETGFTAEHQELLEAEAKARKTFKGAASVRLRIAKETKRARKLGRRFFPDSLEAQVREGTGSCEDRIAAVQAALNDRFGDPYGKNSDFSKTAWTVATYEDYVVFRQDGQLRQIGYDYDGASGAVEIDGDDEPQPVRVLYVPSRKASESVSRTGALALAESTSAALPPHTRLLNETLVAEAVDRDKGTIAVTVIKPGWSLNKRYYGKEVLASAASKLEGARAFGDHPAKGDRAERSIWDQVGYYKNVQVGEGGALKATLKLVGAADKKEHILDWANESIAQGAPLMGISINAVGRAREGEAEGQKGEIVEELVDFVSADVVTRPAAGGAFQQIVASDDGLVSSLLHAATFEEWRDANPEHLARLKEELGKAVPKAGAVTVDVQHAAPVKAKLREAEHALRNASRRLEAAEAAAAALRLQLQQVQEQTQRAEHADALLAQVGIPFRLRPMVREQLLELPESRWDAVLQREAAKLTETIARLPIAVHGAGISGGDRLSEQRKSAYQQPLAGDGDNVRTWMDKRALTQASTQAAAAG